MEERKVNNQRNESYPKPTLSDEQLKNQPEFINEMSEASLNSESHNESFNPAIEDDNSNETNPTKRDDR